MTVQERQSEFDNTFIKEVSEALESYFKGPLGLIGDDFTINLLNCNIASATQTGVSALGESSNHPRPLNLELQLSKTTQRVDFPFNLRQKLTVYQSNQNASIIPSFAKPMDDAGNGVFNPFNVLVMAKMMEVAPGLIKRERDGYLRMAQIPGINTLNVIYPPKVDGLYGNPDSLKPLIITEFVKGLKPSGSLGTVDLFEDDQVDEHGNQKRPVFELLMEQMQILHNYRFIHGDAKLDNFGYLENKLILLPIDPQGKADFSKGADEVRPNNPEFSRFFEHASRFKRENNIESPVTVDDAMYEGIIDDMSRVFNSMTADQLKNGNPTVREKAKAIFENTYLANLSYPDEVKARISKEFEDSMNFMANKK